MLMVLSGCPNYFGEILLTKRCIVGGLDNIILEGCLGVNSTDLDNSLECVLLLPPSVLGMN